MTKKHAKKQKKYNQKWQSKHKWQNRQIRYRTTAKTFIRRGYANNVDLITLLLMCIKYLIKNNKADELSSLLNKIDLYNPDTINRIDNKIKTLNPKMITNSRKSKK